MRLTTDTAFSATATAVYSSNNKKMKLFRSLLSILFPTLCCHCGEPLVGDERNLCTHCMCLIPWTGHASQKNNITEQRLMGHIPIQAAASLMIFQKGNVAQSVIHQIKYHGNRFLAHQYGQLLGEALLQSGRFNDIDCLVPVPLHRRRIRQRGYNQSLLLCEAMSEVMHLPVVPDNLRRIFYTESQTRKGRDSRFNNMHRAFSVRKAEQFENRHILLVDDIITTGATTGACYQAMSSIPGLRISAASLAIASH